MTELSAFRRADLRLRESPELRGHRIALGACVGKDVFLRAQDSELSLGVARRAGIGHAGQMTVARAEQLIAAQLSVRDGRAAIAFYKSAFGATEDHKVGGTEHDPSVVAQLSVGGTSFWVADESPEHENFSPESLGGGTVRLLLIAEDPQATIDRAVAAGAVEIYAGVDQHGWCLGRVCDPFGHHWEIGKPLGPWPPTPSESPDQ